ncbi:MAG TPA: outer membrane protein assembly factor BamA [Gammaproteobacteria bacterium]|nr:outer membrane protein assembly factor BamA [Gammaproteobacteria bacterium]
MKRVLVLLLCLLPLAGVRAFDAFVVKQIRIEGLARIELGTVLNYLPLAEGDTLDARHSAEIIRDLFKTGFFDDIRLEREGDTLVVKVRERPAIAEIKLSGNKDLETDQLLEALKSIGLAEGRIFDRSSLARIEKELERQYYARGKYGVRITSTVSPVGDNRVKVAIEINEGDVARIRRISIVGNHVFSDSLLLDQFQLSPPTILSFLGNKDQYSRQRLAGDLESLRSYYLDRGYINFSIESTQVSITPDRRDVYITITVSEGEKYTVSGVRLAGDLVVEEAELRKLLRIGAGDVFSRRRITESVNAISERLGQEGFAFANITPSPDIDKTRREVSLTFLVDPGRRVYVRHINIVGNTKTRDSVVRRELRQLEGGWISTQKINRSRIRLQRLGFFDEVNVETPAVPGIEDQMDVNFSVSERSSGSLMAGLGYSQGQGLLINASISQNNILGTGNRISLTINNSDVNRVYSFSFNNPYYTIDGISLGFRMYNRQTDARQANVADYTSDVYGGGVSFGIPLSEYNRLRLSLNYENTKLNTSDSTPLSYLAFIGDNGDEFNTVKLGVTWSHDTRNRAIFPDRGGNRILNLDLAVPAGNLDYYKLRYRQSQYFSLAEGYTLLLKGEIADGDSYGDTTELPFWERYYAGGPSSVRGFRSNRLGPREDGVPRGGVFKLVGNAEMIVPVPFAADNKSLRLSAFFDIGNVFERRDDFSADELRYSAGVSVKWLTPMAPLTFSYAWPLNDEPGDDLERFQFSLGAFGF